MREYGLQFDRVAEAYDRERPGYPDELIDAACEVAGLAPGDRVLEVGCGTGKLTGALVERGLSVVGVDPGARLIETARRVSAAAQFVHGRFEDVALAEASFAAVFSAAAFHWLEPEVSWAKAASLLEPGGSLVLIHHVGVAEERTDAEALELGFLRGLEAVAPEIAATFPTPRGLPSILSGAQERSRNVSEVWSWISQHELAVDRAAELFDDVRVLSVVLRQEWSAEKLNAHLRTTSLSFRLGPERTERLEAENERLLTELGGHVPLTFLAVAVTARRRS